MIQLHTPLLIAHVLVAVLGLGSITAVAILARGARQGSPNSTVVLPYFVSLLRLATLSLVVVLATGILLDVIVGGAFRTALWLRASAVLLVTTGVLLAGARRMLRHGLRRNDGVDRILRQIQWISYAMCTLIALIVSLMLAKPL